MAGFHWYINEAKFQGQKVTRCSGIAKVHRSTLEPFHFLEAETARGLLRREYQVFSMYKDDTG